MLVSNVETGLRFTTHTMACAARWMNLVDNVGSDQLSLRHPIADEADYVGACFHQTGVSQLPTKPVAPVTRTGRSPPKVYCHTVQVTKGPARKPSCILGINPLQTLVMGPVPIFLRLASGLPRS